MINLTNNEDTRLKNQMEFLLGREIPLTPSEVNSLAHLTEGNTWVLRVLDKLGLTISDVVHERDREILNRLAQ